MNNSQFSPTEEELSFFDSIDEPEAAQSFDEVPRLEGASPPESGQRTLKEEFKITDQDEKKGKAPSEEELSFFENIESDFVEPPSLTSEALRHVTREGSRMLETILGLPGDIQRIGEAAGSGAASLFFPQETNQKLSEVEEQLPQFLPGSQSLQDLSEQISQGFTAPQTEGEKTADNVVQTFTSLAIGPKKLPGATRTNKVWGGAKALVRNLGMAFFGEKAKQQAEKLDYGPFGQEAAKMGTMVLMGMTLPRMLRERSPEDFVRPLYNQRDALIPEATTVNSQKALTQLEEWTKQNVVKGISTPEKSSIRSIIEPLVKRLRNNPELPMDEWLEIYRNINRNRQALMSAPDLDKAGIRNARRMWGDVAHIVDEQIVDSLGAISPEALQFHQAANSATAALNQSKRMSGFIQDVLKKHPVASGVSAALGTGVSYSVAPSALLPALVPSGAIGYGAVKGLEAGIRFATNPTLRRYYQEVMMSAFNENRNATITALDRLDRAYKKELKDPNSNLLIPFNKLESSEN